MLTFFLLSFTAPATSQIADLFSQGATIIQVHPGEKIQSVIDKAKSGAVILVSPGTYYETIKMKSHITLKSEKGPEATIIDAQGADQAVVVCADKSIIDGFTITGRGSGKREKKKGIHAVDCTDVSPVIRNCIIRDNDSTGINVRGKEASPLITGNKIYQNAAGGIGNDENSKARIIDNEIYRNGLSGIGFEKGAHPLVEKNLSYENEFAGFGVSGKGTSPTIRNNESFRNRRAGIGVEQGASPVIEGNTLFKNGRAGIGVSTSSSAFISHNTSSKNTLAGICIKDGSTATIVKNEISLNIMAGLTVLDHSQVEIKENLVLENGTQGIIISNSQATIANNTIEGNHHHGVGLYSDTKALVEANTVKGNGADDKRGAGIMIVGTDNVLVRQNTLQNNFGPGVQTRVSAPLITDNYLENDSVFVRNRSGPTIRNNTFTSYGKVGRKAISGVNVRNQSFPLIIGNKFMGLYGVNVRRGSKAAVIGNTFSGSHKGSISSGRSGVKVSLRSSPIILRNLFYNKNRIMIKGRSIRENVEAGQLTKRKRRIRRKRKKSIVVIKDNLFL